MKFHVALMLQNYSITAGCNSSNQMLHTTFCLLQPALIWATDCCIQYFVNEQYVRSQPIGFYTYSVLSTDCMIDSRNGNNEKIKQTDRHKNKTICTSWSRDHLNGDREERKGGIEICGTGPNPLSKCYSPPRAAPIINQSSIINHRRHLQNL